MLGTGSPKRSVHALPPHADGANGVRATDNRYEAMKGYTKENTRLLCGDCDYRIQQERGFA